MNCKLCGSAYKLTISTNEVISAVEQFTGVKLQDNGKKDTYTCGNCAETVENFLSLCNETIKHKSKDDTRKTIMTIVDMDLEKSIEENSNNNLLLSKMETIENNCTYNEKNDISPMSHFNSLDEDAFIAENFQLHCIVCGEKCEYFRELKDHFKKAHDMNGYVLCCNIRLYKRECLIDHINLHLDPDFFRCQHCNAVYEQRICLRNHLTLMHRHAVTSICCEFCGEKCLRNLSLIKQENLNL